MNSKYKNQYFYLVIIYIISFLFLLSLNIFLSISDPKSDNSNKVNKIIHHCYVLHISPFIKWLTSSRGKNYYTIINKRINNENEYNINEEEENNKKQKYCLVSLWAIAHVFTYMVIGFFCPNLFIQSFICGALFEFYEKYTWDCHDKLDVIFNSIGFVIGYIIYKNKKRLFNIF